MHNLVSKMSNLQEILHQGSMAVAKPFSEHVISFPCISLFSRYDNDICFGFFTFQELLSTVHLPIEEGGLLYMIHTQPGPGPQLLTDEESLLNDEGLPKYLLHKRKIECVS